MPGLTLLEGFVGEEEEAALLDHFVQGDGVVWAGPLRRRVQHYGCVYDHTSRRDGGLAWVAR